MLLLDPFPLQELLLGTRNLFRNIVTLPGFPPKEVGSKFGSRAVVLPSNKVPCQEVVHSGGPGTIEVGPAVSNIGH